MVRVGQSHRQLLGVVVMCIATTFCGGSSPTSPSAAGSASGSGGGGGTGTGSGATGGGGAAASTSCRTGIATYRIVTTGAGFTSTIDGSCTFNNTTVEGTCTNNYTDTLGSRFTSVSTTRNASRGEVVDEVSVVPPLNLSSTTTTNILAGGTIPASSSTSTRTFSGRRVLANIATSGAQTTTTTYSAWDSSDRPTAGTQISSGQTTSLAYAYDNATRTQTIIQPAPAGNCTQTFDVNGNPLVGTCGGSVATFTTLSTMQICR